MHGFLRQFPEYRQAKSRGEQEERDRVLSLIRQRTEQARARERHAARELEAAGALGDEAATAAEAESGAGDEEPAETPAERRAEARAEARGAVKTLEELQRAVGYGWRR